MPWRIASRPVTTPRSALSKRPSIACWIALRDAVGFEVDGQPVRSIASENPTRTRWLPGPGPVDVEFVAHDIPAFGWRCYTLATTSQPVVEEIDEGRAIEAP